MRTLTPQEKTANYYQKLGSRIGYRIVMRRSQHFGYYDENHTDEAAAQARYHEKLEGLLDLRPSMKVLDAGCGQGVVACYLAGRYNIKVTGITVTPHEVENATKRSLMMNVQDKTNFIEGDYSNTPFDNETFDRIYTTESLSHASDVGQVMAEFKRILKPGGLIVCAEYEMDHKNFDKRTMFLAKLVKENAAIHGVFQFGRGEFATAIEQNGFADVKVYDWTKHTKPSFDRLRRLARPMARIIRKLGLEKRFVNVVAAAMYSDGVESGVFAYKVYVACKPKTTLKS